MNDEPRMMNSDGRTFREFVLRGINNQMKNDLNDK
jgi:hypothetical protein